MTIQELYAEIGGNYEQALKIMKKDKLIDKYVRKLKKSRFDDLLTGAGAAMDAGQLFDTGHAMKGVCANLGLDALAEQADLLTEEFRPGNPRKMTDDQVQDTVNQIRVMYGKVIEGIDRYEAE